MRRAGGGETLTTLQRRLASDLDGALKRRPADESRLAGALRTIAPLSAPLRHAMLNAVQVLVRRKSFDRDLYSASVRALVDANEKGIVPQLAAALACDDAGGNATLSAACFCK